ncbi:MAG: PrsW family intramembrane metalloprotease [Dactylosporangium sp.]|nr:PrsW family intramembrane metalloprotease [Dactylosporangium sp.]NNJ63306.1 PrsW family intramembrane metalloprotease [Dactylosporangium sp.]
MSHPPQFSTPGLALAAAPPPPNRVDLRRGLTLFAVIGGIALCGIGVLVYVGRHIGPVALAVGIGSALLPVPLLVACFLWLDRYEPKPVKYLALAFAWGAGVATAISLLVNTLASQGFERLRWNDILVGILVAPVIEELTKAAGPILIFWRRRKAISGLIDGIVFCGLSATGFAMVENILYLGNLGYAQGAEQGGALVGAAGVVRVFLARIVMSGFAHPLFTAMTGIGLGLAARAARRGVRWLAPLGGLLAAMLLHGSWNTMASLGQELRQGYILLYGYVSVMMPIFFGMVGLVLWLRSAEGRLAERVLSPYVQAGWFSPPEIAALGTLGRRSAARRWARQVAGDAGAKAMRAYQFEATRLALLRDGVRRGVGMAPHEVQGTLGEERRLLTALAAYRQVFTGRDPHLPRAWWDGAHYHIAFPDGAVRALRASAHPVVPVPVTFVPRPVPGFPYR